jgi:hypothetical protein
VPNSRAERDDSVLIASYSGERVSTSASSNDRPDGSADRTCSGSGRVAFGRPDDPRLAAFVAGRQPVGWTDTDTDSGRWTLGGVLVAGRVDDDVGHAAALDALIRGADVVADVSPSRVESFMEDVDRAAIVQWRPSTASASAGWAALLDALAAGESIEQAARRCHLSLRSAHRQLAKARVELGVSSTAAAVARWASRSAAPYSAVDE